MNQNNKITFLINSLCGGGAERVCVTIANGFSEQGWNVKLLTLNLDGEVYRKRLLPKVVLETLNYRHARTSTLRLLYWLRRESPDRILVFNHELAILLVFLRWILRADFRIVARNRSTLSRRRKTLGLWHGLVVDGLSRLLYCYVDKIVAQSKGMTADLIEHYRIHPSQITCIYNPVSPGILRQTEIPAPFRRHELLYVGRLAALKGLDDLLDIFAEVAKIDNEAMLRLVGQGPEQLKLEQKASMLGLAGRVIFEGFQPNVTAYYQRAKAVVLTSYYEGFPNVLAEAISVGTPVVAFDCPSGPSEIIQDGINGCLIRDRDKKAMAAALLDILSCPERFQREQVRATAKKFSRDNILPQYLAILENQQV